MNLPIDVVPSTGGPPLFRWTQVVDGVVQQCEGMLPASCESAVAALIEVAKKALTDNVALRARLIAANKRADELHSELQQLQQREVQRQKTAETKSPQPHPNKK